MSLGTEMSKTRLNKQFDKTFGLYVKRKRESFGWTQAELAGRMDNNFQNISRIERGQITPTLFWCSRLAHVFGMNFSEMIAEINHPENKRKG